MKYLLPLCLLLPTTASLSAEDKQAAVKFEAVVPARQLINKVLLSKDGVDVGNVADIIVDRKHGKVAFVTARTRRSTDRVPDVFILPPTQLSFAPGDTAINTNATIKQLKSLNSGDTYPTRFVEPKQMQKLYDHYDAKPYWKQKPSSEKFDLITVDELDGRIIRGADWNVVGRVQEVLLAPKRGWQVAYLSLGHLDGNPNSNERAAVPMSAFAIQPLSPTWLLDLPQDTSLLDKRFSEDDWPLEIHRGWIEYTHVRYGTSALSGLQDLQKHRSDQQRKRKQPSADDLKSESAQD